MDSNTAQQIIDSGGIVSSGGYTYGKGVYFSYGTYPGCVRGGDVSTKGMHHKNKEWEVLSERDIVCKIGYREEEFYHLILNDGTVNFNDLWEYIQENTNTRQRTCPDKNAAVCRKYFELMEEQCGF